MVKWSRFSQGFRNVSRWPFVVRAAASIGARAEDDPPMIDVRAADVEMNAAIAKARSMLPKFWASYAAPKPWETGHSLKVRFTNSTDSVEHIWMVELRKIADHRYSGRFANVPQCLPGKREGDVAEFEEADISDWLFVRNGKVVGGETIKPLFKSMPKDDADAFRARMESP
jgi:uncharacterized protein YegJ (DUF2314 family)